MCTRYYIEPEASFQELFENVKRSQLMERMRNHYAKPFKTSGEIFPTDLVPVIAPNPHGKAKVYPMIFGYKMPRTNKTLLNALGKGASGTRFLSGFAKHLSLGHSTGHSNLYYPLLL